MRGEGMSVPFALDIALQANVSLQVNCGSGWCVLKTSKMTHLRQWLSTVLIVSVPIEVPGSADAMLLSELGNR